MIPYGMISAALTSRDDMMCVAGDMEVLPHTTHFSIRMYHISHGFQNDTICGKLFVSKNHRH